ncbi:hypothetical protein EMCRGX_G027688 [Ephydatia muelleri]|eukprot:Em0020g888a
MGDEGIADLTKELIEDRKSRDAQFEEERKRQLQAAELEKAQMHEQMEMLWKLLAPYLTGKAQLAYAATRAEDMGSYHCLKEAILRHYISEEMYWRRFREAVKKEEETMNELTVRLNDLLQKWTKECKMMEDIRDMMVQEQLLDALPRELKIWVAERKPKTSKEAAEPVDNYLWARKHEHHLEQSGGHQMHETLPSAVAAVSDTLPMDVLLGTDVTELGKLLSRVSAKFREQLNALWLGPDRKRRQKERVCRSSSGQKRCEACQKTSRVKPRHAPLIPLPIMDEPFQKIAMDIVGPLPRSSSGNQYVLVICDYATRYPEAVPMRAVDAESIAEELVKMFARVGIPGEILTDQGSNFTSQLLTEMYRLLHIRPIRTTPYHPQRDGLVERFNQTLKSMLRKFATQKEKDWDKLIPYVLFAYCEVPQRSTGFSPFKLLYSREVRGPLDVLQEARIARERNTESVVSHVLAIRERMEQMSSLVKESLETLNEGDMELVLLPTSSNALIAQWQGPYKVTKQLTEQQRTDLDSLMSEFAQVLANTPGRTQFAEHCIKTGSAHPVRLPAYRIPHAYREIVQQEIEEMLEEGIIEHSNKHLVHIREVLSRLQGGGLTAKPSKCHFGMLECTYLGHVVGNRVVQPKPSKVQAVMAFPIPSTKTQVRGFLGLTGYYRRFIPNYGAMVAILTNLTKKSASVQVQWSEQCNYVFEELKRILCCSPVLRSPDFKKPFVLQTDASDRGVGTVLSQKNEAGDDNPNAHFSKKLQPPVTPVLEALEVLIAAEDNTAPSLTTRDFGG